MSRVGNYHSKEREKEIMWIYIVFFLLIMFCIVNLLSGFYFTKLIKNFLKALPIFLKDLYVMDRDIFRRLWLLVLFWTWRFWKNTFNSGIPLLIKRKISKSKSFDKF